MEKLIKQYLTEYLAWAEADAPEHESLNPYHPICNNARHWARADNRKTLLTTHDVGIDQEQMVATLKEMFDSEGMDMWYPFGEATFYRECHAAAHHRNPERLAWVRKQLEVK